MSSIEDLRARVIRRQAEIRGEFAAPQETQETIVTETVTVPTQGVLSFAEAINRGVDHELNKDLEDSVKSLMTQARAVVSMVQQIKVQPQAQDKLYAMQRGAQLAGGLSASLDALAREIGA